MQSKGRGLQTTAPAHQSQPTASDTFVRALSRVGCELAQQLYAVEKAIGEARRRLIHDHVDHCLDAVANGKGPASSAVVSEFKAISRYL
jgi:DNA-binding FrmR family transcriptional regulator